MTTKEIKMWDDTKQLQEIKTLFAPNLTDQEFKAFIGIGKATGLNPFLKEIWAVKGYTEAAQIFIGRDGYRKSAQRSDEYDYHYSDAVYENDEFSVENGEVKHKYNLKNRGKLLGGYCVVKRKSSSKPVYNYVDFVEYYKGNRVIKDGIITDEIKMKSNGQPMGPTIWDTKPATMIKKVPENQGLKGNFQELFAGTYGEDEQWDTEESNSTPSTSIEEQQKNFETYGEVLMNTTSENELREAYLDIQKKIKENQDFLTKEQQQELLKIKNELKAKFEKGEEKIVDGEVEVDTGKQEEQ